MSDLHKQLEALMAQKKQENQQLKQQLQFIKQAQKAGLINKPQYNLASQVNVISSIQTNLVGQLAEG